MGLIRDEPGLRDARLTLLSATRAPAAVRAEQVAWFMEHEPETFLADYAWMAVTNDGRTATAKYHELRGKLLASLKGKPDSLYEAVNAAWFQSCFNPNEGVAVLDRHTDRGEWSLYATFYLQHLSEIHVSQESAFAELAVRAGCRAFRLEPRMEKAVDILGTLRTLTKRSAESKSGRYIQLAGSAAQSWHGATGADRRQLGYVLSGLVSAAGGELREGVEQFARAADVDAAPSASLLRFAAELVSAGHGDAVFPALDRLGARLSESSREFLAWSESIRIDPLAPLPAILLAAGRAGDTERER
jgi:hypothetical protein